MLKYCLGCVRIIKNRDRRKGCPTNAKQGDWFVFDMIFLSVDVPMFLRVFYLVLFGQFLFLCAFL